MNTDSVSIAFDMILAEIDSIIVEVNSHGSAFIRNNEYGQARSSIEAGEKLAEFRNKLQALNQEWINGLDAPIRRQVKVEVTAIARTIASGTKSSKTVLVVKFEDGAVIFENMAADTFVKTIQKMGLQRVLKLEMKVNNFDLVSHQKSDIYNQTEIDGYYIMTHSNTDAKRNQLLKIAGMLNLRLTVDVVPA